MGAGSLKTGGKKAERNSLPENATAQTLPKSCLLRKRRDFDLLFTSGKRIRGSLGQIIVLPWSGTRVGFVVGKRVGNAVQRNRLRRYLREFYRTHKHIIPSDYAVIFQVFPQDILPNYRDIESEFIGLCQKLSGQYSLE